MRPILGGDIDQFDRLALEENHVLSTTFRRHRCRWWSRRN
jgi:hypothetical protein